CSNVFIFNYIIKIFTLFGNAAPLAAVFLKESQRTIIIGTGVFVFGVVKIYFRKCGVIYGLKNSILFEGFDRFVVINNRGINVGGVSVIIPKLVIDFIKKWAVFAVFFKVLQQFKKCGTVASFIIKILSLFQIGIYHICPRGFSVHFNNLIKGNVCAVP